MATTEQNSPGDTFTLYKDKIYNMVYKMTGNADLSKDITQETFLKYIENQARIRGESNISTWLYAVARNSCFQYLKNEKRSRATDLQNLQETVADPDINHIAIPEKNNYINQVKEGCLLGLLRTLSLNQRLAFILFTLHEMPVESIANILNKTESATRTLIHRARRNIREFVCDNCTHYNSENRCRCENMINFSLKKGWIKYDETYSTNQPEIIKTELNALQKIISLYSSLPDHKLPAESLQKLSEKNFLIFSEKKVK